MEDDQRELQLLPTTHTRASYSRALPWPSDLMRFRSDDVKYPLEASLDLQLSISLRPPCVVAVPPEALKWEAADQIRMAEMEKAYAERVREMTQREMEMAQSEFSRARHMWERAREEVEKVEKMKERATRRIDSNCLEITCQSCRQKFRS